MLAESFSVEIQARVSFTPIIDPDNPLKLEACLHTLGNHLLIDDDRGTLRAKITRRCQHNAGGNIGRNHNFITAVAEAVQRLLTFLLR